MCSVADDMNVTQQEWRSWLALYLQKEMSNINTDILVQGDLILIYIIHFVMLFNHPKKWY